MTTLTHHHTPEHSLLNPVSALILTVWFLAVLTIAITTGFTGQTGIPGPLLLAVAAPVTLFLAAHRASPALRTWVQGLDLTVVTATQAWRVVGAVFVFLWLMGDLPAVFAIPAGFGDVAVGLFAVYVTAQVARRTPDARAASYRLILAGMLDFAVAFTTGIGSNAGGFLAPGTAVTSDLALALPVVIIPAFLVPLFMILHLIAWIKLRSEI